MFGFRSTPPPLMNSAIGACWPFLAMLTLASPAPAGESAPARVDYQRDIRPILSDSCFACHGPDEDSRKGGFRLDDGEGAFLATSTGLPGVTPGKPQESELWRRISSSDSDELMPPPDSGKKLTRAEIDLIRRWIDQGAPWQAHWAFIAPQRPIAPAVSDEHWSRTAIDRFLLQRLDEARLNHSPEASKETLIRRATLALTGIPPTIAEVDAFLANNSPAAYERLVDRLLASPHYGEHMARYWLDAARYGDTHGLHLDNYREMWLYRDWVVGAFNSNLPYDQFTIQQLAGDLLPNPEVDQRVATGFCRANVSTNEGGSIEEEVFMRNVVDRVSATGAAFMGLTLGCAVCHDHKFDPITQKEFYQLFAFFNSLDGPALDGNVKDPAPVINVPDSAMTAKLQGIQRVIEAVKAERQTIESKSDEAYRAWISSNGAADSSAAPPATVDVIDGLVVSCNFDGADGEPLNAANPKRPGKLVGEPDRVAGPSGKAIAISSDAYAELGNVGDFQDDRPFSYGAWIKSGDQANGTILAKTDAQDLFRGYELSISDGLVRTQIGRRDPGYLITVVTEQKVVEPKQWRHVFVTYDGSRQASGLVIYVDGQRQPTEVLSDALKYKNGIRNSKPLLIGRRDARSESAFASGHIDDVRVYDRRLSDADVLTIYLGSRLPAVRDKPRADWTPSDNIAMRQLYLLVHDSTYKAYVEEEDRLANLTRRELASAPTTLVFREQRRPRDAFVLIRGQYDQPGEKVARGTPAALPPMRGDLPRNRLGLAGWLVAPEHPLTSRVAVNRLWQQFFGVGLVKTSEDFGVQGATPSHPELLDWLAVEFRESGWDVKALVKQMVMSAAFRQTSRATPELLQQDPENRLLARGPRYRLEAEVLRDQALVVSNLLVDRMGGPGVKPPQPEGLWEAVGFIGSNTAIFVPDTEFEKTHRRSLYTFLKRTAPPPQMSTFDAPSREAPCTRRERTNTPMQALLLLNDPQYVEAARSLAERVMGEYATTRERAACMYRLCTAKHPKEETVAELSQLYNDQLSYYRSRPNEAQQLVSSTAPPASDAYEDDELAAWTVVGNLMLNLDEVITAN